MPAELNLRHWLAVSSGNAVMRSVPDKKKTAVVAVRVITVTSYEHEIYYLSYSERQYSSPS